MVERLLDGWWLMGVKTNGQAGGTSAAAGAM